MKSIAVYCGASMGTDKRYEESAIQLGKWIARNAYRLVYGGGKVGLMGVLAQTVLSKRGYVTGIIPKLLADRGVAYEGLSELIIVADMSERKQKMITYSDCCIALPGGPGTLEEITEAISWARLGENPNPCIFFNVNHYYEPIAQVYDRMVEEGFLTKEDRDKILITDSLDAIDSFLVHYTPPIIRQYATLERHSEGKG
ncbi:MAG: TIGR00730 family Rossman fold protein [Sporolactobacillus sp.]